MGGPKKPTLKQLEKRLARQRQQQQQQERGQVQEKSIGGIMAPSMEELAEFAKSQRYLTPYIISEKFGIRLSVAKQVLNRLAEAKVIRLVAGDSRLRIYAPVELAEKAAEKKEEKPAKKRKKQKS